MFGFSVLISLISHFSNTSIPADTFTQPAEVVAVFDKADGLKISSAVLVSGSKIGEVVGIERIDGSRKHSVKMALSPLYKTLIKKESVAIAFVPVSETLVSDSTTEKSLVVELFSPEKGGRLLDTETIKGFSSYEKLWSSDLPARVFEKPIAKS